MNETFAGGDDLEDTVLTFKLGKEVGCLFFHSNVARPPALPHFHPPPPFSSSLQPTQKKSVSGTYSVSTSINSTIFVACLVLFTLIILITLQVTRHVSEFLTSRGWKPYDDSQDEEGNNFDKPYNPKIINCVSDLSNLKILHALDNRNSRTTKALINKHLTNEKSYSPTQALTAVGTYSGKINFSRLRCMRA